MTSPAFEHSNHELPRRNGGSPSSMPPRRTTDWTAVTAVLSGLTALASIVIAVATLSYVGSTARISGSSADLGTSLTSLWRLRDEWDSQDMASLRTNAAAALLDHQPNGDVDDILFFLDEIAFLWKRGALDEQLIWYEFYWPMANYWAASQDRVRTLRDGDPSRLRPLAELMQQLLIIEMRERNKTEAEAVPSGTQIHDFLTAEIEGDPCMEDDDELRRFPT